MSCSERHTKLVRLLKTVWISYGGNQKFLRKQPRFFIKAPSGIIFEKSNAIGIDILYTTKIKKN